MDFGVFHLSVIVVVGIVIGLVWLVNRRRGEDERISLPSEAIAAAVVVAGVLVVLAVQSGIVAREPLASAIAAGMIVSLILVALVLVAVQRLRRDLSGLSESVGSQMAGLGNLQFYPSKNDTFAALVAETLAAKEKLIATRFSPADISIEDDYWSAIRHKAMDPKVLYIRIHCLAHASTSAIDGVCRLISELRGATQFRLGIAFFNNDFELILADEKECIFCFHDLEMTIRNGFRVDTNLPSSAHVVENFGSTLRRMISDCYLVVDFGRWVRTAEDAEKLQSHLRDVHAQFRKGRLPERVHPAHAEEFLQELFGRS